MQIDIKTTGERAVQGQAVTVYTRGDLDIEVDLNGPGGPGFWFNIGEAGVNTQTVWVPLGEHKSLWESLLSGAIALDYAMRLKS